MGEQADQAQTGAEQQAGGIGLTGIVQKLVAGDPAVKALGTPDPNAEDAELQGIKARQIRMETEWNYERRRAGIDEGQPGSLRQSD